MYKYIFKRLVMLIPVIIGVTFLVYFILDFAPGDPVAIILGIEATEEDFTAEVAKMAEQYKMEVTAIEEMLGEGGKKQIMGDLAIAKAVDFVVANAVEK